MHLRHVFESSRHNIPVEVLEECVDVCAAVSSIVDHVCMFVDIKHQDRHGSPYPSYIVAVHEVVVQSSIVEAVCEDHPSAGAFAACDEFVFPFLEASPF